MRIQDLDTPALLIDLDILESNLTRMAQYAATHQLRLRPHTKTHKIPALGRRQLELGAMGLTVAKVSEAEVMLASHVQDLLIAYPMLGPEKARRAIAVSEQTRLMVSVDSVEVARPLGEAFAAAGKKIRVLVEVDAGLGRVGVAPERFGATAKAIAALPGIDAAGIAFYPGHIKKMDDAGVTALGKVDELIAYCQGEARAAGLELPIVSGGSTPTMWHSHLVKGMNEMRPGTYIFNDRNTIISGACTEADCAATILTTVVSTSVKDQFIIDGGSKTFSSDKAAEPGHGLCLEHREAFFEKMNEEHGFVKLPGAADRVKVGEKVRMLMNHVCVAVNLQERIFGVRGQEVERIWTVDGRGKLQ